MIVLFLGFLGLGKFVLIVVLCDKDVEMFEVFEGWLDFGVFSLRVVGLGFFLGELSCLFVVLGFWVVEVNVLVLVLFGFEGNGELLVLVLGEVVLVVLV